MPLFTACSVERSGHDLIAPRSFRYRAVQINPVVLLPGQIKPGDRILVTPFGRKTFMTTIDRVNTDVNGVLSLRGRVDGSEGGYLLISIEGEHVLGCLSIPEEHLEYGINYLPGLSGHIVQEVDPSLRDVLEDGPALIPPSTDFVDAASLPIANPPDTANAAIRIDVMIVYTPAARDWAEGQGGINLIISQAMVKGQLCLDNSNTDILLRLAYSALVDYQEADSSNTDLNRLTRDGDGYMDVVHQWRNAYGADLVQLFTKIEDTGGLGYLLNTTAGRPDYAFSLARVQQASDTSYTSVHELGHNMGCHHRKDQTTEPGPGLFSYSAGWRWLGSDGSRYCSVMSYADMWNGFYVFRAPYFSNPNVYHLGAATGNAADGDNARTLRETKEVIAGYRPEAGLYRLIINATTGGTTNPSPGSYFHYDPGSIVRVTALPGTHYFFNNWSGDASGSQNPVDITMDGDRSITANFLRIIYPPSNAKAQKILNRSFSQAEYINIISWEANPNNINIEGYKVYLVEGAQRTIVTSVGADRFTFQHRKVEKSKEQRYEIVAVNNEPREGSPAIVVAR